MQRTGTTVILCAARMLVHACKHVLAQLHGIYITALNIEKCRFIQLTEYPTLFYTANQLQTNCPTWKISL